MGYIYLIVVGAVLGWLAAFLLRAESSQDLTINIGTGVIGALLTGLIICPEVCDGNLATGTYTVDALFVSIAGSIAALFLANFLRYRESLYAGRKVNEGHNKERTRSIAPSQSRNS